MKPTDDLRAWAAAYREAGRPPPALRGRILVALGETTGAPRRTWRETIAYAGVATIAAIAALVVLGWVARSMGEVAERRADPNEASYQQKSTAAPQPAPSRTPEPAEITPVPATPAAPAPIVSPPVSRPSAERPVETPPPPVADAPTDLESLRLLRAAERMLHDDPSRARELLDEHARKYPTSTLAVEREALWIRAACRTGDESTIAARRASFARRAGIGGYLAAIEKDCDD